MESIGREIFKAVHGGTWLDVRYVNEQKNETHFWAAVKDIDPENKRLVVDGLHLSKMSVKGFSLNIEAITSAHVVEDTWYERNEQLIEDISLHPSRYEGLFSNIQHQKVLEYLVDCNKLDNTPYCSHYALLEKLDGDSFSRGVSPLTDEQFAAIVRDFSHQTEQKNKGRAGKGARPQTRNASQAKMRNLCLNVLSISTNKGLYVLAYRRLSFDVKKRQLRADDEITICREFILDEKLKLVQSIKQFLDVGDLYLLDDFEDNAELIKDAITAHSPLAKVNDLPYLLAIARSSPANLEHEYSGISSLYDADAATPPLRAFFGELVAPLSEDHHYPLALIDRRVNLDQLYAIYNAASQPLTYVQGPPGTGKTHTILNTIITAFFNEKTVLVSSYNNLPVDNIVEGLRSLRYRGRPIPLPILRIGNQEKILQSLAEIAALRQRVSQETVHKTRLDSIKSKRITKLDALGKLLDRYHERIELADRRDAIERLSESVTDFSFQVELQAVQANELEKRLTEIGEIGDEDALALLDIGVDDLLQYLYYRSVEQLKRLEYPEYEEFRAILDLTKASEQAAALNLYLSDQEKLEQLTRVFPIVATTCISATRLGEPKPLFDLTIIDEASQCNSAITLIPIIRGQRLMLVGDPQQLNPIVVLDEANNAKLRAFYGIPSEYDYCESSIYKTFLACDAVSNEILLRSHYRCDERIIGFSNRKYYNKKLSIKSRQNEGQALEFIDVGESSTTTKNVAPKEVDAAIEYAFVNKGKDIGIITPFANQRQYLAERLLASGLNREVSCGTVHAYQGDEKDIIVLSLACTKQTGRGTYLWLRENRELINVATTRAREKLVIVGSKETLESLHNQTKTTEGVDDLNELIHYVVNNGDSTVSNNGLASRALGVKPYSSATEEAFLANVNHALDNIAGVGRKLIARREVPIAQVFRNNEPYHDLFYSGRFDFVIYEDSKSLPELPLLAVELDGREHFDDAAVRKRDAEKTAICREHGFELIRVENSYARRYVFMKNLLIKWFVSRTLK